MINFRKVSTSKNEHFYRLKKTAFTLAEVLITLGIIGIVAALTVPNLIQSSQEAQWVAGLQKFNTNLQQAVQLWKEEIGCSYSAGACLASQNLPDGTPSNFDQIGKFLKIAASANGTNTVNWLPETTLNYYGDETSAGYGKVAHAGSGNKVYLLQDGTTFSMDIDPAGFDITVDVNGKKPPNRMGKDTFKLRIGDYNSTLPVVCSPKDICYNRSRISSSNNGIGLCGDESLCQDMHNVDPTIKGGAAVTSYVILNHKIPDFKALAKTIEGFKP